MTYELEVELKFFDVREGSGYLSSGFSFSEGLNVEGDYGL